jgi:hypothetical protein
MMLGSRAEMVGVIEAPRVCRELYNNNHITPLMTLGCIIPLYSKGLTLLSLGYGETYKLN